MHHTGPIAGIATSGRHVATAGYDNRVILWNGLTGRPVARALHDHLANQCAFSPDGNLLVSASSDYSARIWEVPTMRLKAALLGHGDDVDMAEFSPDGSRVATCALDRLIRIFDLEGHCLATFAGHTGNIISVVWTSDGRRLVSSSVDGTVREWDASRPGPGPHPALRVTELGVRTDTVVVTPEGLIYAGDDRGRIALLGACAPDAGSGKHLAGKGLASQTSGASRPEFIAAHRAGVKKIAYDAGQRLLVSLSYDRTIAVWQADASGHLIEVARSTFPALIWPRSAAFWQGDAILVGTFGSSYATFDWRTGEWTVDGIEPDPSINAVTVMDGEVYTIGDAGALRSEATPSSQVVTEIGSLCNFLLPSGPLLLTGGQLGTLIEARSGAVLHEHRSPLNCGVAFWRNGRRQVAIGTYTGEILVFEQTPEGALTKVAELAPYENAVKGLAASDDTLFSVCASTAVAWHALDDLHLIARKDAAHERIANACCTLGDRGFASVGRDRKLRLWELEGESEYDTPHPNSIKCLCSSEDGNYLLSGSYGGTLAAFDVRDRRWCWFERVSSAGISSVAFDPGRERFVAASYDGQLHELPLSLLKAEALVAV